MPVSVQATRHLEPASAMRRIFQAQPLFWGHTKQLSWALGAHNPVPRRRSCRRYRLRCSTQVWMSASSWQGWCRSVSALITGTRECAAKRSTMACELARITMTSTMRDITRAVSSTGSPRSRCVSRGERNSEAPPSCAMPASNDTRVRVEDFSKIMASVLPASGACSWPRRCSALSSMARAISRVSSAGLRSARREKVTRGHVAPGQEFAHDAAEHRSHDLVGLCVAQDQRRQQADHAVGGDVDQQSGVERRAS